jgi:hypothetical protein
MASAVFKLLSKAPKGSFSGMGSGSSDMGDVSGRFGRGFSKMGDGASKIGSKVGSMFTDEYGSPNYTLIGITLVVCCICSIVMYFITKPKGKKQLKHPGFDAFDKYTNIEKSNDGDGGGGGGGQLEKFKTPPRRFSFGDLETFHSPDNRDYRDYKGYVDGGHSPWKKQVVEEYIPFSKKFESLNRPKRYKIDEQKWYQNKPTIVGE